MEVYSDGLQDEEGGWNCLSHNSTQTSDPFLSPTKCPTSCNGHIGNPEALHLGKIGCLQLTVAAFSVMSEKEIISLGSPWLLRRKHRRNPETVNSRSSVILPEFLIHENSVYVWAKPLGWRMWWSVVKLWLDGNNCSFIQVQGPELQSCRLVSSKKNV